MPHVIIGLVGSLRKDSYNRKLMNAGAAILAPGFSLDTLGLEGIPLYDGDVEANDGPMVKSVLHSAAQNSSWPYASGPQAAPPRASDGFTSFGPDSGDKHSCV